MRLIPGQIVTHKIESALRYQVNEVKGATETVELQSLSTGNRRKVSATAPGFVLADSPTVPLNRYKLEAARVKRKTEDSVRNFAKHVLTVVVDHGPDVFRHYRCHEPGTSNMHFNVYFFPGRMIVSGDIGFMAWERTFDMLIWARGAVDSIDYFAEKVPNEIETKEWDSEVGKAWVWEVFFEMVENLVDEEGVDASNAVNAHKAQGWRDTRDELMRHLDNGYEIFISEVDNSDWSPSKRGGDWPELKQYTTSFLWCREAVKWLIRNLPDASSSESVKSESATSLVTSAS